MYLKIVLGILLLIYLVIFVLLCKKCNLGLKAAVINSLSGLFLLIIMRLTAFASGIMIPINIVTVSLSGIMGPVGIILYFLIDFLFL